jgi:hypothetical protein
VKDKKEIRDGWNIELGRWNSLRLDWKQKNFSRLNLIQKFFTSFPIIFLEWMGRLDKHYYASEDRFGAHNPFAPHNLYRQVWHFNGGAIANVFPSLLGFGVEGGVLICIAIILIEAFSDLQDFAVPLWQRFTKSILDVTFWFMGTVVVTWVI